MKKAKVIKGIKIGVSVLLALAVIILGILFFPLMGEKHVEIWTPDKEFDITSIQTVEKAREDFKILLFTDTQLWSNLGDNKKCYEQMDELVERAKPDLILLLGDNVSALASRFSLGNYIERIDSYGVPWAPVFGNHDAELPTNSKNWQCDKYMEAENCLMQKGPTNLFGLGNYAFNIVENGEPVYTFFMMDNGTGIEYDDGTHGEVYMDFGQIAWYEWNVKGIAKAAGRVVPSMTVTHFPQPEFQDALEELAVKDENGWWQIPKEYGEGYCMYDTCSSRANSGFFDKCKELGSTKYMLSGHDHEHTARITYEGITFAYGLKTGPSPDPWNSAAAMGGTVITINGKGANQSVDFENIVLETTENS